MTVSRYKKVEYRQGELVVRIPDTRGVTVAPYGLGNLKIGPDVLTYSKLPGRPTPHGGSCPGASPECLTICYAFRIRSSPLVWGMYEENTRRGNTLPPLPEEARIVRIHVSGDFDTREYIAAWWMMAQAHKDVRFFGYTRSWRVPELLADLELLRAMPNVNLLASMDKSIPELPPEGWRRAWLRDDPRISTLHGPESLGSALGPGYELVPAYLCPEETGRKANCQECRYCIDGKRGDVVFLVH